MNNNDKPFFPVNGRNWYLQKDLKNCQHWTANYYSSDGDGITLYINNDKTGFTLQCFSGICASSINIDSVDYGALWRLANWDLVNSRPLMEIQSFNFIEQSLIIADYFCNQYCEYYNQP